MVGGGLTAIDTATEALAYPVQVEEFLRRYETLALSAARRRVRAAWTEEEAADGRMSSSPHARALREARACKGRGAGATVAAASGWLGRGDGGLSAAAGRVSQPTLNHEEVAHGMAEGIRFLEGATPRAVEVDRFGHAAGCGGECRGR